MTQDTNIAHPVIYDTAVPTLLLRPTDSIATQHVDADDYLLLCNDSVFAPYAADSFTVYRESMFAANGLASQPKEPSLRDVSHGPDWMFLVIVALLTLMSLFINRIRFNIKDILVSLFNLRIQSRVERENNVKITSMLPMTGIYLASVAAVATRVATSRLSLHLTVPQPLFYAIVVASLVLFILMKGGLIRLIGNIFDDRGSVQLYLTSGHLFYFAGGMLLPPLLLFVYFAGAGGEAALIISAALIAIILITRLIRGLQLILTNSRSSKLYLFYYLCILEIVPILAMVKILTT